MEKNLEKIVRPFDGLLIADVSGTVATAYTGKLFSDYGARVVNVESPDGFPTRNVAPLLKNGSSALHGYLNVNKESVVTSCPHKHASVLMADLVLVDPHQLPSELSIEDFDTNVCAISWFGLTGPYTKFNGSDAVIHALTGLMIGIGEPEGPPLIPKGYQAQILGGLSAFNGCVGFLTHRLSEGKTDRSAPRFKLDASIFEANLYLTDMGALGSYNGESTPLRLGINRFSPTYPLGIWPCKDGWIGVTVLNPGQCKAFCKLLDLGDIADEPLYQSSIRRLNAIDILEPLILESLAKHNAEDIFQKGQAMRIPLARVPTMDELFSVDQFEFRQAFCDISDGTETFRAPSTPFRLFETPPNLGGQVTMLGGSDDMWTSPSDGNGEVKDSSERNEDKILSCEEISKTPLEGIIIIDLSMGWAGPVATKNAADLGATVIKVEGCVRFDWFRSWEATQEWIDNNGAEKALNFVHFNRNKLGVTIEYEKKAGYELLVRLLKEADAVLENYSGGVMSKLNLGYQQLVEINPKLVVVSLPAFGSTGPWAKFRAYGSTAEQATGLPHLLGDEHQSPAMQHVAFGDAIAAVNGTAALLTALYHKFHTGKGQFVDLSHAECILPHALHGILHYSVDGIVLKRSGNIHPDYLVFGVFPCKGDESWILIQIVNDVEESVINNVPPLRKLYDKYSAELFSGLHNEINACVGEWTKCKDAKLLMNELQDLGVTAAVLNDGDGLLNDPHLVARGYMQLLERPFVGTQIHPSPPWRVGESPIPVRHSAPTMGQHNDFVFKEMLGLSTADLSSLERGGIIGTKPRLA